MGTERHRGHERGQVTSYPLDGGPVTSMPIYACAHCDYHWTPKPGSGIQRGFCTRCHGLVCGRPSCLKLGCTHWEQRLENMEAGRPLDFRRIIASVPIAPPRK